MSNVGTAPIEPDDQEQDIKNIVSKAKLHKRWTQEIKFYERKADEWHEKAKKIIRRYKDDRSPRDLNVPRFNILWSNVQTLGPALYARKPKPDIERRFRDKDDLGRLSSMVLERSISYFVNEEFDSAIRQAVTDRLLAGRGTVWARYEPHFKDAEYNENEEVADEGLEITDNVESYDAGSVSNGSKSETDQGSYREDSESLGAIEEVSDEVLCWDYVHWQDFGHTFGRTWDEVDAVWRKVYLTRDELIERFGEEIGEEIKLDYSPHDIKDNKEDEVEKKATIYEIWCKSDKTVYWIHKDYLKGPLDQKEDPLRLQDFWPTPRPLFATLANDTCIPVPDYKEYQDQAAELDNLTSRIGAITRAVKVAGVYDSSAEGIERLLAEGVENQLVPVKQYAALSEKGGLKGVIDLLPMQEILQTLLGLYESRDKVKQDLYEITGIADIMRGASDPNETYGAQRIKSQFGTLRLSAAQDDVQRFVRDLIRIGTQVIAEHFSIDTIKKICGMQLLTQQEKMIVQMSQQPQQISHNGGPPMQPQQPMPLPPQLAQVDPEDMAEMMEDPTWEEVYQLLRNELMLSYKIDIETDSTIKFDQQQEQAARVEFLSAAGGFLQSAMQVQNPDLEPLLAKMLMFGIRGFKVGKELESTFETAIHRLEKDAQDPSKKKPDPEMQKVQAQMAIEQFKSQQEQKRLELQAQVDTNQAQLDAQNEKLKNQGEQQLELTKAKMDNETKIIVAKIAAGAKATADGGSDMSIPSGDGSGPDFVTFVNNVMQALQQTFNGIQQSNQRVLQSHQNLAQVISQPKKVVRDENNRIVALH